VTNGAALATYEYFPVSFGDNGLLPSSGVIKMVLGYDQSDVLTLEDRMSSRLDVCWTL